MTGSDRADVPSPADSVDIRLARVADAHELARLFTQLGHPTSADDVDSLWGVWEDAGNAAIVAGHRNGGAAGDRSAVHDGALLGAVTIGLIHVLHRRHPVGRITSLVVDERSRGMGIGRSLVAEAERALIARGCRLIEVTSNLRRADAHAFYERLGYERTSLRFAKRIEPTG